MAPVYNPCWGDSCPTQITNSPSSPSITHDTSRGIFSYYIRTREKFATLKEETKEERIARIAKKKMLASWDLYNEKSFRIKKVIQICKPKHRLNHIVK